MGTLRSHVGEENDAHAHSGKGQWMAGENLIGKLGSIHTVKELVWHTRLVRRDAF